ncbi:MAG: PTS sugar transporter subunit IIA [Victivallaceae bacterium]|nr:PTS sugar transporter subunit IIA [Victivallaceae bacterium]MDD3702881.1 PTS sugar transporter subunit IIA [Victivallaceae bacterium]MDD4318042.1 PTS sugar transporter subunit IIA [Victivallaceae bacterium]MDD5663220.1 PTS sugar transporter subunit IIA [Victivallaceae bacterium]
MKLSSILNPHLIFNVETGGGRKAIYETIVNKVISGTELTLNPEELATQMIEREDSIMIPYDGVALPHLRLSQIEDLYVAVAILNEPVRLKENDAAPSRVVIMSLISENTSDTYLKMLTAFAKYLAVPENLDKISKCRDGEEVLAHLDRDGVRLKKDITAEDIMSCATEPVTPGTPLQEALDRFVRDRTDSLPVVGPDGTFFGMINAAEVIHRSIPEYLFMMKNVNFLNNFEPFNKIFHEEYSQMVNEYITPAQKTILPSASLIQFTISLVRGEAQTIAVVDEKNQYKGMITIADIMTKILRG